MRNYTEHTREKPLDECVFQITNVLQSYHQDVQLSAVAFLYLEMIEHLGIPFPGGGIFRFVDSVRRGAFWENIQALRGAHLYIINKFSKN